MSTFAYPSDTSSEELAANMDTFDGKAIALQAINLGTVPIKTSFGSAPALRIKVIDLETGELTSPHLLFWTKMQDQVVDVHRTGASWAIGKVTQVPQQADPTRSVYLLQEDPELVMTDVGTTIAKAEAGVVHETTPA